MKRIKKHSVAMPRSQEAYQEELLALKIKMALEKEQQDEIARMQAACEKDLELQQFFLKTQPQALRKIQRAADRARYKRFFHAAAPGGGHCRVPDADAVSGAGGRRGLQ